MTCTKVCNENLLQSKPSRSKTKGATSFKKGWWILKGWKLKGEKIEGRQNLRTEVCQKLLLWIPTLPTCLTIVVEN